MIHKRNCGDWVELMEIELPYFRDVGGAPSTRSTCSQHIRRSERLFTIMASPETAPTRQSTSSPTLASSDGNELEKMASPTHSHGSSPVENHHLNVDTYQRSSSLEDTRPSLYPVTSYASQIGGEGIFREEELEDIREEGEKDPNLVEWDDPKDPNNPYNWYRRWCPTNPGLPSINGG
jgi:hypothetical protein